MLVVNPSLPIKIAWRLIAYVKARPGEVNYGTFGIGTSAHLAALLFESMIGAKMQAVHYRGGAPTAVGVMTGEVQMAFGTALSAGGGIPGGKLRAIAVTSEKRLALFPDVPTAREQGLDYVHGSWFGILAPARTPDPIIRRLYDVIKDTMAQPDVQKPIRDAGNEVWVTSPEEFARFIAEETKLWPACSRACRLRSSDPPPRHFRGLRPRRHKQLAQTADHGGELRLLHRGGGLALHEPAGVPFLAFRPGFELPLDLEREDLDRAGHRRSVGQLLPVAIVPNRMRRLCARPVRPPRALRAPRNPAAPIPRLASPWGSPSARCRAR